MSASSINISLFLVVVTFVVGIALHINGINQKNLTQQISGIALDLNKQMAGVALDIHDLNQQISRLNEDAIYQDSERVERALNRNGNEKENVSNNDVISKIKKEIKKENKELTKSIRKIEKDLAITKQVAVSFDACWDRVCPTDSPTETPTHSPTEMATWTLALNINPSDGNNAGWLSDIWYGTGNVGTSDRRYTHDYKDYISAWQQPFECMAIVRHNAANYDGVKVWKMNESKAFNDHFNSGTYNDRAVVTEGGPVQFEYSTSSQSMDIDPILASSGIDNNVAFNWRYSNNGARVVLTDVGHYSGALSSFDTNDDDVHGLGNDFDGTDEVQSNYWHDASVIQPDCHGAGCKIQGTDHGSSLSTDTKLGNYAFFITNAFEDGSCPRFPFDDDSELL